MKNIDMKEKVGEGGKEGGVKRRLNEEEKRWLVGRKIVFFFFFFSRFGFGLSV